VVALSVLTWSPPIALASADHSGSQLKIRSSARTDKVVRPSSKKTIKIKT
jgi:hypothetical protein